MKTQWFLIFTAGLFWFGCTSDSHTPAYNPINRPEIHKWFGGHTAALSITYDSGWPISDTDKQVQQLVLDHKLSLDYEVVSHQMPDYIWAYIREVLLPAGFGVFGHGHTHVNHDDLTYASALESFQQNYTMMRENLGVTPISYAYPGGYAYADSTTMALRDAGFLSARMHHTADRQDPYILSGDTKRPVDWYRLPALVMQDFGFEQNDQAVGDAEGLLAFLEGALERKAWLITAFHAIGDPAGWGYFRMDEFEKSLQHISARDFWVAPMDDITRYILQREHAVLDVNYRMVEQHKIELKLSHGLDRDRFSQTMTISFDIPKDVMNKAVKVYQNGILMQGFQTNGARITMNLIPSDQPYVLIFI
jgi:hypothetical protein